VFQEQNCGSCHTLAATGSTGSAGPALDGANLTVARVRAVVMKGGKGMPSYSLKVSDLEALARYVSTRSRAR
jgi:cytochrome c551